MPIPSPAAEENENEFMGRCMADVAMQSEFQDQDQRAAVCFKAFMERDAGDPVTRDIKIRVEELAERLFA